MADRRHGMVGEDPREGAAPGLRHKRGHLPGEMQPAKDRNIGGEETKIRTWHHKCLRL
jgi:hypothetical protein